nr:collinsiaXII-like protein [Ipomoea batatas]
MKNAIFILSIETLFVFEGENAGTNSSESDESDWNYEQNCSDGEFDNNEIRDDMDFETHVDPLLEIGGQQGTPTSEQQEGIPTTEQLQGIPTTEEYASIPVNEEQNIMTQEDIDFMSMFDFSTPFEENPTPCQELPVIVEEHIGSASTIQQNEHGVRMCYGIPPPLKKVTKLIWRIVAEARVALCTCFLKSNVLGGFAFIGEGIPVATGAAFSSKYRREVYKEDCDHVTLAFFGDGTCNNGQFYECLNMAALWKLPIVFVVENNLWAIGMSNLRATSDPEIWKKGAFGMPDVHVDGMDVLRATTLASLSLVDYFEFIQTSP